MLGAIADDLTGATDLCSTLVAEGRRPIQIIGVPEAGFVPPADIDAAVVALKSRSAPRREAVEHSLAALDWLAAAGARRFFFKYCSTFDSTDDGNIGPVADALLDRLGADFTIACPAFPENARTVFQGHLFVGSVLLSESPMKDHPLTPMRDSSMVRVLGRQTAHRVALVPFSTVDGGVPAIREAFSALRRDGVRFAIVDAVTDRHLRDIGAACDTLTVVTGGSGVARGLPDALFGARRRRDPAGHLLPAGGGHAAVLAGSCSAATLRQIKHFGAKYPTLRLDPVELAASPRVVGAAIAWAYERLPQGPLLIYTSAPPQDVDDVQHKLGHRRAAAVAEDALSRIARALVERGAGRLVIAGGETSGAVVNGLGIRALRIGAPIDPGVPWTFAIGEPSVALVLKSGNFGSDDFFEKALRSAP